MKFRVVIQPQAAQDVRRQFEWLRDRSLDGAKSWYGAWLRTVDRLSRDPRLFGSAPESAYLSFEARQVTFRTRSGRSYRAIFTIVGDEVHVLHVRGPGQAPISGPGAPPPA